MLGALLAALVVLLFLGSLRSTIIAAVAIPVSIISTFGLMMIAGLTESSGPIQSPSCLAVPSTTQSQLRRVANCSIPWRAPWACTRTRTRTT